MKVPERPKPTFRVKREDGFYILIASLYGLEASKHIHEAAVMNMYQRELTSWRHEQQNRLDVEHWKQELTSRLEEMYLEQLIKQTGGEDGETEV